MMRVLVYGDGHLANATRKCVDEHFGLVLADPDVLWFCMDTPVDREDRPLIRRVIDEFHWLMGNLEPKYGTPIMISSQLSVGTTQRIEEIWPQHHFAYQPENIRIAHAVEDFRHQKRMVVGTRHPEDEPVIKEVLSKFTRHIHWVTPEAAEMAKHTLNAFLAMEIAFANEIAALCRRVGANEDEVFACFRSDARVGNGPLSPGGPYRGGTLGRDVRVLLDRGAGTLINAIDESNEARL